MLTLFIRKVNGKGEKLHIPSDSKISELIANIQQSLNESHLQNQSQIAAYFRGEKLNDHPHESLQKLSLANNSIIHVVQQQTEENNNEEELTIKLILQEKLLEFNIPKNETIKTLKLNICKDLSINNEEDLTLSYLGAELDNSQTISSYHFAQNVLISASSTSPVIINQSNACSVSKESFSEESEGIPKIVREFSSSPKKKVQKSESLNVQPVNDLKAKAVFASVQLKKIDEKVDQSKNDSQINQCEELSEEKSEQMEEQQAQQQHPMAWQKPRLTLESLSKPWSSSQKIIQTESIVDDEQDQPILGCRLELVRGDMKRQYALDCTKNDTFEDALRVLAGLQKIDQSKIKLMINFDEVSKSGISNKSSKGIINSPASVKLKKQRSSSALQSKDLLKTYQCKSDGLKMSIVDYASRLKKKQFSLQYEIMAEI